MTSGTHRFTQVTLATIRSQTAGDRFARQISDLPRDGLPLALTSSGLADVLGNRSSQVWVARTSQSGPVTAVVLLTVDIGLSRTVAVAKDFAAIADVRAPELFLAVLGLLIKFARDQGAVGLRLEITDRDFQEFCMRRGFRGCSSSVNLVAPSVQLVEQLTGLMTEAVPV